MEEENPKDPSRKYVRREAVVSDVTWEQFYENFSNKFEKYSVHQIEDWFLKNTKAAVFDRGNIPKNVMTAISDFAQNIVVIR